MKYRLLYVVGFWEGGEIIIFAVLAIMTVSTNQLYGTTRFAKNMEWLLKKLKRQTPQEGFAYTKNNINTFKTSITYYGAVSTTHTTKQGHLLAISYCFKNF